VWVAWLWFLAAAPRCDVRVGAVVEASVYRGSPSSAAKDNSQMSQGQRDFNRSHDHGVKYLSCTFAVTIDGVAYTYEHRTRSGTPLSSDLDDSACNDATMANETRDEIVDVTNHCTDFDGAAYYGYVLTRSP
jgi:hypothetical protein